MRKPGADRGEEETVVLPPQEGGADEIEETLILRPEDAPVGREQEAADGGGGPSTVVLERGDEEASGEKPVAVDGATRDSAPVVARVDAPPPRLVPGIELIGRYEDSGFKDPPFIARRPDGQMVQLPALLYLIAERADGRASYEQIGQEVSEAVGRGLSADNVRFLVEKKLQPIGLVAGDDGDVPELAKPDPLLALKFKTKVVSERAVRAVTSVFRPFFLPPVLVAALAALLAFDGWLFFVHGVGQPARQLVYHPLLLLMVFGMVVAATALHEIGHASALRYGGAKPGVMGVGLYLVWPAFYTDITDAYRLGRWGRVRTDLGGIYFNGIFVLGTAAAYFATGFEPLLIVVLVQHLQVFQQLMPFLRLDGYYVLSDLTGVPDLFLRIGPVLASLLPWRETDPKVTELKRWVRVAVTAWVCVLVPVLLFILAMTVVNAPRILATGYDSFLTHYDRLRRDGGVGRQAIDALEMLMIALPAVGMVYSFSRTGRRFGGGAWRWSHESPLRRATVVVAVSALAAGVGYLWWPNGDYRPIQPGEHGTVVGGVEQLSHVSSGRPGLTPERERSLDGAPTERSREWARFHGLKVPLLPGEDDSLGRADEPDSSSGDAGGSEDAPAGSGADEGPSGSGAGEGGDGAVAPSGGTVPGEESSSAGGVVQGGDGDAETAGGAAGTQTFEDGATTAADGSVVLPAGGTTGGAETAGATTDGAVPATTTGGATTAPAAASPAGTTTGATTAGTTSSSTSPAATTAAATTAASPSATTGAATTAAGATTTGATTTGATTAAATTGRTTTTTTAATTAPATTAAAATSTTTTRATTTRATTTTATTTVRTTTRTTTTVPTTTTAAP